MGKRLVISCIHHNECIAKIYYHWSAYTLEAFKEAAHILKCITPDIQDSTDKILLRIMVSLYSNVGENDKTGGLCTPYEERQDETIFAEKQIEYIKEHFPELYTEISKVYDYQFDSEKVEIKMLDLITKGNIGRSMGLMCIVPNQFHFLDEAAEGELEINFDTKMVYNKLFRKYTKEEFTTYFSSIYDKLDDFHKKAAFYALDEWIMPSDFSLDAVPFNKINYAVAILLAHIHTNRFIMSGFYLEPGSNSSKDHAIEIIE